MSLLRRLETFAFLETRLKSACNTSYLLWHYSVVFPLYLTDIYENTNIPNKLHFMVFALRDCIEHFHYVRNSDPEMVVQNYLADLISILEENFLSRYFILSKHV